MIKEVLQTGKKKIKEEILKHKEKKREQENRKNKHIGKYNKLSFLCFQKYI